MIFDVNEANLKRVFSGVAFSFHFFFILKQIRISAMFFQYSQNKQGDLSFPRSFRVRD
jgi:hypothetical protein